MDEQGKIDLFKRMIVAWNAGDLDKVAAEFSDDFEWDLRRSDIPGEMQLHRGRDAYVRFARRWQDTLGPTQVELEEAIELPDGRLYLLIQQSGTGARSGANVDIHYVQIHAFEGAQTTGAEVFTDQRKGRVAAGLGQ